MVIHQTSLFGVAVPAEVSFRNPDCCSVSHGFTVSASYMLGSEQPLYKRLVVTGGPAPLMKPLPTEVADMMYIRVTKALGLDSLPVAERIKALVDLDGLELLKAVGPSIPMMPVVDSDIIKAASTFASIEKNGSAGSFGGKAKWCEAALIGDCALDVSVRRYALPLPLTGRSYRPACLQPLPCSPVRLGSGMHSSHR